ncbi:Oleosin 21.2 kDa [Hibiscus syriacus]|uniref:Oleosin 21.2 kDa n=1 Tax=Hibiscus syriacus TaxID=106335 RepID=A0A6A3BGL0_HIBSY|nr:Oleosin 21.2 kDa [Hibiscus syriacus]
MRSKTSLDIAVPIFLIFSPVLVPAAVLIAGSIAGFLTSGAFGITGLSSQSWIANFLRGRRSSVSQQLQMKWLTPDTEAIL